MNALVWLLLVALFSPQGVAGAPVPTMRPSAVPTRMPTKPTIAPTKPTAKPTLTPTMRKGVPTARPTFKPTARPSPFPTKKPTFLPTSTPTSRPSSRPTSRPSSHPTSHPTGKMKNPHYFGPKLSMTRMDGTQAAGGILAALIALGLCIGAFFSCRRRAIKETHGAEEEEGFYDGNEKL